MGADTAAPVCHHIPSKVFLVAMIIGPRVIFDKSFIQSLNGALIDEDYAQEYQSLLTNAARSETSLSESGEG
jgi:hypothetical protein